MANENPEVLNSNENPPKKRRGRPPGAKNKEKGSQENQTKPKGRGSKKKQSAPLIDTIPNDPDPDNDVELEMETRFTRIIKASNAAYDDLNSFDSFDNSFDDSVCRDAIRQEMA